MGRGRRLRANEGRMDGKGDEGEARARRRGSGIEGAGGREVREWTKMGEGSDGLGKGWGRSAGGMRGNGMRGGGSEGGGRGGGKGAEGRRRGRGGMEMGLRGGGGNGRGGGGGKGRGG
ncbi:hypothetical protein FKM82_003406 [Ascaphus truei]